MSKWEHKIFSVFLFQNKLKKDGIITLVVTTPQIRSIQSNSFSFVERKTRKRITLLWIIRFIFHIDSFWLRKSLLMY